MAVTNEKKRRFRERKRAAEAVETLVAITNKLLEEFKREKRGDGIGEN